MAISSAAQLQYRWDSRRREMRRYQNILVFLSGFLFACGNQTFFKPADNSKPQAFGVWATIPRHNQSGVPLSSGIIIRFPEQVDLPTAINNVALEEISPDKTAEVDVDINTTPSGLFLRPRSILKDRSTYRIRVEPGVGNKLRKTSKEYTAVFHTGARRPLAAKPLRVEVVEPDPNGAVFDASSIRVYFNETLDRRTLIYGDTFKFQKADSGEPVAGMLFSQGSQAVFDPDEDMTPGEPYKLSITAGLRNFGGEKMAEPYEAVFYPISTQPRIKLNVMDCPSHGPGGFCSIDTLPNKLPKSGFTGLPINTVNAESISLGDFRLYLGASLIAEAPEDFSAFPNGVPLILRKGQSLQVTEIPGKLGGAIYGGIEPGNIDIRLLTDGVAILAPSSQLFNAEPGGPPGVSMTLDGVFSFNNCKATGMLSQAVLGIQMLGLASTDEQDKSLVLDAAGFAEIEASMEYLALTLDVEMRTPQVAFEDKSESKTTSAQIFSPLPGETKVPCESEIIVFFDGPVDPRTARDNIKMFDEQGKQVPVWFDVTEPKVYLIPLKSLDPQTTYTIKGSPKITDITGKPIKSGFQSQFTTMAREVSDEPPMVGSTYPGAVNNSWMYSDHLPEAYFTQLIDPATLIYGETVLLWDNERDALVPASLEKQGKKVRIFPDSRLTPEAEYSFILTEGITNTLKVPLDTDFDRVPGGPDRIVVFKAKSGMNFVQTSLFPEPYADADGDGYIDKEEEPEPLNMLKVDLPIEIMKEPVFISGGLTILSSPIYLDPKYGYRLPMWATEGCMMFGTSTGIGESGATGYPGLLQMGLIRMAFGPDVTGDGVQGDDKLIDLVIHFPLNVKVENPLFDWLLVNDVVIDLPGKMRFTDDGRQLVMVNGEAQFQLQIPGQPEIPLPVSLNAHMLSPPAHRPW